MIHGVYLGAQQIRSRLNLLLSFNLLQNYAERPACAL